MNKEDEYLWEFLIEVGYYSTGPLAEGWRANLVVPGKNVVGLIGLEVLQGPEEMLPFEFEVR